MGLVFAQLIPNDPTRLAKRYGESLRSEQCSLAAP
jgi:hypothetical protein